MNLQRFVLVGGALAISVAGASVAHAAPSLQPVVWHTDRTLIEGTACDSDADAFVITSGSDVSLVFTSLQVLLASNGARGDTAGRAQCSVRIPVDVARGTYVSQMRQMLTLAVTKSDFANVSAGANAAFFNVSSIGPQIRAVSGWGTSLHGAVLSATTWDAPSPESFCASPRPNAPAMTPGIFRANVGVSAQRESALDEALIGAGPADVRLDVDTTWAYCP